MNSSIVAALIIFIALIFAGFLAGGRYAVSIVSHSTQDFIYEVNRFTGAIRVCVLAGNDYACSSSKTYEIPSPPGADSR